MRLIINEEPRSAKSYVVKFIETYGSYFAKKHQVYD